MGEKLEEINIDLLTDEEFIAAYESNIIKFKYQGANFNFKDFLNTCLATKVLEIDRAVKLDKLYYKK